MANIRVDFPATLVNGQSVIFRSPVDCSQITGLVVFYIENDVVVNRVFQFADAHGNNVGSVNLFAENVLVKVILDTELNRAFVQNADTNAYIERTFVKTVNGTPPDENGNVEVAGGGSGGVSITHEWDGTVLKVTSASGTSSADLQGPKGNTGKSVTITHIAESDGDGAINMVAFSDGKTMTIKNGSKGSPGITPHIGENGNWWIGETDTGVSASGSGGTGGIPLPETASAGQFIRVSAVDENGVVVATEAVDAPTLPAAEGVAF